MPRAATVAPPTPSAALPVLPADLADGLRRLKLGTVRRLAPEILHTAKVQRWTPEEVLRTLIEAECASRDESNLRTRLRGAGFPVAKSLDEFKVAASSVPQGTFDYLTGLEWIPKAENLCLVGPARTGKSHLLVALGHTAVAAGHKVRYLTAAELVEQLYRGVADNSVGRVIDTLLRFLLVHYAVRTLMHHAAAGADIDPDRVSFTRTLRLARRQVAAQAAFSPLTTDPSTAPRHP